MSHVRGKPCLLQELHVYIFYTFHNVFAEILWHFSLDYTDVELLVNLLATLKILIYLIFLASLTIFLNY